MSDYLWTGNELAECERACHDFLTWLGRKENGVTVALPGSPWDLARAAFVAGWQAHQQ